MKRLVNTILCVLCLGIAAQAAPVGGSTYDCGTWLQLSATPYDGYHFVEWSDGNKDSLRHVEVTGHATYIAFFAETCENPSLPVVALYDWLIMLNMREIQDLGYSFNPTDVTWYRVVGEPDDLNGNPADDQKVCNGFYLTLAKNLKGTGDYYAKVNNVANPSAQLCSDVLRSVLVHFSGSPRSNDIRLLPNATGYGGIIKVVGLDPTEETTMYVYSSTGQLMDTFTSTDELTFQLQAAGVSGCYYVRVVSPTVDTVLKYVVFAK